MYTFRSLRSRINPAHLLQRPPFSGRILSPDYGFCHSLRNTCRSVLNAITHSQYMFHLILKRFNKSSRFSIVKIPVSLHLIFFFHEVYGIRPNFIPVGEQAVTFDPTLDHSDSFRFSSLTAFGFLLNQFVKLKAIPAENLSSQPYEIEFP